jgi:predicted ATPase
VLKSLEFLGFKSIRKHEPVEFGKVNLFIGGNGVGKSNILEALGMLGACFGADITANELQKKGVRLSVPTLFKSAFKNSKLRANFDLKAQFDHDLEYDVSISANNTSSELSFFSEHLRVAGEKVFGRSNHGFSVKGGIDKRLIENSRKTRGLWDRFQDVVALPSEVEKELNEIAKFTIYAPQTAFLRGTDIESNQIKPLGLNGGGLASAVEDVMELLKQYTKSGDVRGGQFRYVLNLIWTPGWTDQIKVQKSDPSVVSTQVRAQEKALYFRDRHMHTDRNLLSVYDSSEGTLYLLFIAVLLLHPDTPTIFALDNIDNALNPSITRKLLETIIRVTCDKEFRDQKIGPEQIFLTSHNPTSLDAFNIFDDEQRIFVVSRDENGHTKIARLSPPKNMTRSEWVEKSNGKNLSELWIEGKIKGALGL